MPGPPPPPPPMNNAPAPSAGGQEQGRNLLLESIRAGKSLKKTVTNDKSAPAIGGKVKESTNGRTPPLVPPASNKPGNNNIAPVGLGGLFAGGMPKLKPTGLRGATMDNVNTPTNSIKRGPPPAPPPANQKPQILPPLAIEPTNNITEEPKGYGKSLPLPKTPTSNTASLQRPSPPPKKLNLSPGASVSRAQSMRLSRSPPVLAPAPPSLHQSQDCLNENQTRPVTNRVLRPPVVRPPSPPTSKPSANTNITRVAPPPPARGMVIPPVNPPPPPPPATHRTLPHQRLAPPPPPTPPTRCSSTQNGQTSNSMNDFEVRFAKYFHPVSNFPPPNVYQGLPKVYSSKNAPKPHAPPPPSQSPHNSNSMLPMNMSSTQGKQWHTSLAC